jgi:UDP-glucuronate decarboxylase
VTRSTISPARPRRSTTSTTRPDDQDIGARRDQHAGPGQAHEGKIFQASTSEVYGDPESIRSPKAIGATSTRSAIRSCYDEGKRCAETLFFDYHRQHGIEIKVARIFNTYGPRMHPADGRVVSNFIVQALKRPADHHLWRRRQTRSFCYVDDLVEGFLRLMDTDPKSPGRSISATRSNSP